MFTFKTFAAELLISINQLLISINTVDDAVFIDINNSFIDIISIKMARASIQRWLK